MTAKYDNIKTFEISLKNETESKSVNQSGSTTRSK